jgi:Na+/melibiose symporter-like transporter
MSTITGNPARHREARPLNARPPQIPSPTVISEPQARVLAVLGMVAIVVIHIVDAPSAFIGARYIFWLYMAIVVGAVPVSLVLLHWPSQLGWIAVAALAAGPLVGYLLTRTVGLPGDTGDIGNWIESLGIASLFAESAVLGLALTHLALASQR